MSDKYIGEIFVISWPWAPNGSAYCDGTLLQVSQNAALYSLIGNIYGGTAPTTFGVPDLRNRFPVGSPTVTQPGAHGGSSTSALPSQVAAGSVAIGVPNLPPHTHPLAGTVAVTTTIATNGSAANQPKPGGNLLAKGQDSVSSAVVQNYTNAASDGTSLGGVSSAVTSTLAVGNTGAGSPLAVNLLVSGGVVATVPPFLTINYVITLVGVYPSRP